MIQMLTTVRATKTITEEFKEPNGRVVRHTHAQAGDLGRVVHVDDDGHPTVRFDRSGSATLAFLGDDVELLPQ